MRKFVLIALLSMSQSVYSCEKEKEPVEKGNVFEELSEPQGPEDYDLGEPRSYIDPCSVIFWHGVLRVRYGDDLVDVKRIRFSDKGAFFLEKDIIRISFHKRAR